jgi:hypothetical protein
MTNPINRMVSSSQVSSWFGQGPGIVISPSRISPVPLSIEYLVVAGGGGGGNGNGVGYEAGGGGAGGLLSGTITLLPGSYTATVGAAGGPTSNGSNSVFNLVTSTGGGFGASGNTNAGSGGSGGGGAHPNTVNGTGVSGQGFAGERPDSNSCGGGGGGAGEAGATDGRGSGGDGLESSITGTPTYYAGGGAAWSAARGILGTPGLGGGGSSTSTLNGVSTSGTANTGGGGGGAYHTGGGGTNGGSGVVILKYPDSYTINVGAGLTGTTPPASGGSKITTLTAGTGSVTFTAGGSGIPTNIQEALNAFPGRAGLIGKIFSGEWRSTISTGNIGTLPLSSPTTYTSISYGDLGDNYGFIAIGYFKPPSTGTYTFFTSSDDGSGVWIGDIAAAATGRFTANAVLNNNMGGGQGDTKRSGSTTLTGGIWYPIRIVHEEGGGGSNLTFSWSGPGIAENTSLSTYFKAPMDLFGNNLNTYYA